MTETADIQTGTPAPPPSTLTGGELLVRSLHAEGVSDLWAIPDGTYMLVLEALERLGPELGMRLLVAGHEAAAGHAAEAQTRVLGRPAVAMACAGPGAANLVAAVMCARDEGSPLVAITTTRRADIGDYPHLGGMQVLDQHAIFAGCTKWSGRVGQWKRIPDLVRHAFRVASTGRPGPVHLDIPEDLLAQRGDAADAPVRPWTSSRPATAAGCADAAAVARAAELLVEAERPVLHCGGGTLRAGAWDEARTLAEHLGAVLTTGAGSRGVLPPDHPLGAAPVSPVAALAKNEADVVLVVGSRLGELDLWARPPLWQPEGSQRLVQIDADPTNIGLNHSVEEALVGDARLVLAQVLAAVRERCEPRPVPERVAGYRSFEEAWRAELDARVADRSRAPMVPGQIFEVCNERFADDAVLVQDGGNTCVWAAHHHRARGPRTVLWTSNAGHLGTGLPYAIGAQLALPDTQVYCVSGDSAFRFNIQELETAARYALPLVIIVAVDQAWGMEKPAQQRTWGREAPWFGIEHAPVRYDLVAQAMGCAGVLVRTADELGSAIDAAVASGRPTVIHAEVDPVENEAPPGLDVWVMARSGLGR